MQAAEVGRKGSAMRQVEADLPAEGPAVAPFLHAGEDKAPPAHRMVNARVSQSVVTLAPAASELDPKQQLMAEQFRLLRTRVRALRRDLHLRTMLITSALAGEGKSTVSANLAGSLSHVEGMRVLLIDLDLRRPSLHTIFGVEVDRRAISPFTADVKWQLAVRPINPRLDVLFGYRPLEDPDRLLESSRLPVLLGEARAEYEVVILDSAPLLAVADTQSLVPLVDCGIFVLNVDSTPIAAAKEALTMMRDKVAGCVVNRVQHLKTENYYRNSGYGYGYRSKHTEN